MLLPAGAPRWIASAANTLSRIGVIRLSGAPYTIVRPGWLDSGPGGDHVTIEQGDTTEGSISREALSAVLVDALLSTEAIGKTFEVFSGPGQATRDWNGLFAKAERDHPGALDAVKDTTNMPLDAEPSVKSDLAAFRTTPDAEDSEDD